MAVRIVESIIFHIRNIRWSVLNSSVCQESKIGEITSSTEELYLLASDWKTFLMSVLSTNCSNSRGVSISKLDMVMGVSYFTVGG